LEEEELKETRETARNFVSRGGTHPLIGRAGDYTTPIALSRTQKRPGKRDGKRGKMPQLKSPKTQKPARE